MDYGLQLYSVRDMTEQDLEGTLKKVAEIGYCYVEFAGFFGHSAEEIKAMLDAYGLKVSGTHSSLDDALSLSRRGKIVFSGHTGHQGTHGEKLITPFRPHGPGVTGPHQHRPRRKAGSERIHGLQPIAFQFHRPVVCGFPFRREKRSRAPVQPLRHDNQPHGISQVLAFEKQVISSTGKSNPVPA